MLNFENMTEREKAIYWYNIWKDTDEKTLQRYGRNNRVAISGMKRHEWAIK